MIKKILFFFVILIFSCSGNMNNHSKKIPKAVNGILDLTDWDFQKYGKIELNGEWLFYWQKLYSPQDFNNFPPIHPTGVFNFPNIWNEYSVNGKKIGSDGFGTFKLTLLLNKKIDLGIKITYIFSAYKLWINDDLLISSGQIGTSKSSMIPQFSSKTADFKSNTQPVTIVLQVSNFYNLKGGPEKAIILDTKEQMHINHALDIGLLFFFIGCFLIGSIYHFTLYFMRRKDASTLYFAIATLLISMRTATVNDVIFSYLFPFLSAEILNKISYTGVYLSIPVSLIFIRALFPKETSIIIIGLISFSGIVFELITLFFPCKIYQQSFYYFSFVMIFTFAYILYIYIRATIKKREGALLSIGGALILVLSVGNDVLTWNGFIKTPYLSHVGLLIFFITQIVIIALRFTKAFTENEQLNENLEIMVNERTKQLKQANDQIKDEINQKTNLLINLSHETKTPLTIIENYLDEYVNKSGYSDELMIIKKNIHKLLRDIKHILDIEKYKRGQPVYLHDQICLLSEIVKDNVKLYEGFARQKKVSLSAEIEPQLYLKSDPCAINQLMYNLLDNAIKYNRENGYVHVLLYKKNDRIHLVIEDNGEGIDGKDIEHIFETYFQVKSIKRNNQGIGIGLAIVKKIVDSINGKITVNSQKELGTHFTIILNNHIVTKGDVIADQKTSMLIPLLPVTAIDLTDGKINENKPVILIVEDNLNLAGFLKLKMENDYNIYIAGNGKEALEKLERLPRPDIIISDIMMDQMDGYTFLENISKSDSLRSIPFIFLSALTPVNEQLKGLTLGAVDYISKPFHTGLLLEKIRSILKNKNELQESNIREMEKKISSLLWKKNSSDPKKNAIEINSQHFGLSSREKDIGIRIIKGMENKEISADLGISFHTVKQHVNNIYKKCHVQNRVEFVTVITNTN